MKGKKTLCLPSFACGKGNVYGKGRKIRKDIKKKKEPQA